MIIKIERVIFLFLILFLPGQALFSQSYSSNNNYTGAWETPTSWIPTWPVPQTNFDGDLITIYGYIMLNGSLSIGDHSDLTINDTLVIEGDLLLDDHSVLTINDNGILIVRGNLVIDDHTVIVANGYLIITGNVTKTHNIDHGSFTSNDNPVKVFTGGTIIPVELTDNNPNSPIFDCTAPLTIPYPNSNCSYGNMTDLINDPIYSFFQSACSIATPNITVGGPTTFCAGDSVSLTSSAGTTYLWSNGASTPNINVATSGSYTVQVSNASGCLSASSAPTVVTVNALPTTPAITASGPTTFCDGDSVTLSSSAETSYLWSNGETTSSINVTEAGSYDVQVSNANGCQSAPSVASIVTVNAIPATPTISADGPTTFCDGDSVTLTSSAETSYLWSTGASTPSINVSTAGSYSIQVGSASGCQSAASAATVINVNALPVVNAGADATIPNGTSTTIDATVTGPGPFVYSWAPSGQLVNPLIEDPTTVNLAATNVFTLTATSISTSCSGTDALIITVSGGPLSSNPTATPGTICAGADVQLQALSSGGSGSYTYTWTSTPVGFTSSIANPITNPAVNTTYSVAVFDGFTTVNSQIDVIVNALPATPTISAIGPTTFCDGDSVTLTSSPESTYQWSSGAGTSSINVSTSGAYSVQVSNASGCQSAPSVATIVTVNPLPVTPTITAGGPTTFCDGDSVSLTSIAGTSYLWSNSETTASINVTTAGSYTVQVSNASGCQSAPSVARIVTVNTLPATPTIAASGPTTFCDRDSVTLTSSAETSYLWSTGAGTPSIYVATAGSYSVQVSNANGCQSASSVATIVTVNAIPATPTITASGPTIFCDGDSVTLASSPESTYQWSTGASTPVINVTTSGAYSVQVTHPSGCQSAPSAATIVTVNALPAIPAITASGPTTFCDGESVTLTSSTETSYLWSTGETTPSINVITAGSYTVLVSNASGCQSGTSANPIIVNIYQQPVAYAGPDKILEYQFETFLEADLPSNGEGIWKVTEGTAIIFDLNDPKSSVSGLSIGTNIFTWQVNNGVCPEVTDEVVIVVNDMYTQTIITPNEDGLNDELVFPGLTEFPGSSIIIYNRWGSEVYRSTDYKNNWNGKDYKSRDLIEDTYYYILKISNDQTIKGFIEIVR